MNSMPKSEKNVDLIDFINLKRNVPGASDMKKEVNDARILAGRKVPGIKKNFRSEQQGKESERNVEICLSDLPVAKHVPVASLTGKRVHSPLVNGLSVGLPDSTPQLAGISQYFKHEPKRNIPVAKRKRGGLKRRFQMENEEEEDDLNESDMNEKRGFYKGFQTAASMSSQPVRSFEARKNFSNGCVSANSRDYGLSKKTLGTSTSTARSAPFKPPVVAQNGVKDDERLNSHASTESDDSCKSSEDAKLTGIDDHLVDIIKSEIMERKPGVSWDDVVGLDFAKEQIREIVVYPLLRPDLYKGLLRSPAKGLLLFGPPGTGKTLLGKCVASQCSATFFNISASSLTSKWVGDGEKLVRALFTLARRMQPSVIFIDEVDSLLTKRTSDSSEHESSRRLKTEFLVQFDGASSTVDEKFLVIGATNRPQEIDEAARRRFTKRLYIPLPDRLGRASIVMRLLKAEKHELTEVDMINIAEKTEGYSCADMVCLCSEAAMGPLRSLKDKILEIDAGELPSITVQDFEAAFSHVTPSVSDDNLQVYEEYNKQFGAKKA